MKVKIFALATLLSFSFMFLNAGELDKSELFQYDKQKVEQTFSQVNQLEQTVKQEGQATLEEVKAHHPEVLQSAQVKENMQFTPGLMPDPPLGIPSVLWGICFSWVGVLIVYLVTEDKEETKKALIGFCIFYGIIGLIYVIYVIAVGAAFCGAWSSI